MVDPGAAQVGEHVGPRLPVFMDHITYIPLPLLSGVTIWNQFLICFKLTNTKATQNLTFLIPVHNYTGNMVAVRYQQWIPEVQNRDF